MGMLFVGLLAVSRCLPFSLEGMKFGREKSIG
jgi:hypothetical protein